MIVYYKLDALLKERKITKTQLKDNTGLSTNVISKVSRNEGFKTETINRICEYLRVQPGEIMEWIPDAEYSKQNEKRIEAERAGIKAQIAALQKKLDETK
jgi:DNA-binding Xre family transcriptional regulator|nr:helix-turn-helix transcriptional regulator [Clostridium sp. Marseille-P7770]DAV24302.1 MAG TPA: Cro/C1-type HTH DNA-binding domain protein [Bacteriophage sp.]